MKFAFITILLLASVLSFGAGYISKSFSKIFYAPSEAELVQIVESSIPSIERGDDEDLTRSMKRERCDFHTGKIKVGKLFIKKIYTKVDGALVAKYRGLLVVNHSRCFESYK